MKTFSRLLVAGAAGLLFVSCAPTTPEARIEKYPEHYARLGTKEKAQARTGRLSRGMSKDGVFIAWGPPSSSYLGNKDGKSSERWDYTGSRPVYTTSFFGGFGYWPYGYRHPYSYYGAGVGPEVTYIPYTRASVWFVNDRVDSWEQIR